MLAADGILVSAEVAQTLLEEHIQPASGISVVDRIGEIGGITKAGQLFLRQLPPRGLHGGRSGRHRYRGHHDALRQLLAVVGIKTPLAAEGSSIGIQQDAQPLALHFIELGHQRLFAAAEVLVDDG